MSRHPCRARHPYDVSKSCARFDRPSYAVSYKLPVAITRCGNFYGGGDLNWNRIVPRDDSVGDSRASGR